MKTMKRAISIIISTFMLCNLCACAAETDSTVNITDETVIELTIGKASITIDGTETAIDAAPVIISDRTLLPVSAIIEAVGGNVHWENETQNAVLTYNNDVIILTIDSTTAFVNETEKTLDVAPAIINERTMLPIRFIAENFGFDVEWDGENQTVTITAPRAATEPESTTEPTDEPVQTVVPTDEPVSEPASGALQTTDYTINGVDFKMILVEKGTFTMGSDNNDVEFNESPAHTVTLTQDYLMGETEVTEALWNAVMGNGGGSNTHPKTSVTWQNAHTFVDRLNELAHEQGLISDDVNFHLPTEAQWEFAAKGGNLSRGYLYSGSNNINEVAVTYENSGSSSPIDVKTKAPNELGLYDMSGNAYEWVDDYGGNYSSEAQTDPQNTSGRSYVKRGGSNYHSFSSEPYLFTTTGRYFYSSTDWTIGFRICLY